MKIFIWRHSKRFSSWSMLDEPHICKQKYIQADVTVLANSKTEALELLRKDENWNVDEIERIEPEIISLDQPMIIGSHIDFQ